MKIAEISHRANHGKDQEEPSSALSGHGEDGVGCALCRVFPGKEASINLDHSRATSGNDCLTQHRNDVL